MAITFDAVTNINNIGSPATSVSGSHTIGSGGNRIVWVFMSYNAGSDVGVTFNGVNMINSGIFSTTGGSNTTAYYLVNPPVGTNTVVATTSSSATILLSVASYFGVRQYSPMNTYTVSNNVSTGTTVATSLTTVENNSWVIGCTRASVIFTLGGSGFTERMNQSNLFEIVDTNGSITPEGTTSTYTVNRTLGTFSQFVIEMSSLVSTSSALLEFF